MLNFFTGINSITINEIIQYNSYIGKNVYVIDVYRTPIERKFSEFFEKISPYHFNNSEENINNYSIKRVTDRFNKVFPYLAVGDHYIGSLYSRFKNEYKLPINYLEIIKNDKYLTFYYSEEERIKYLNLWSNKLSEPVISYTDSEYLFYVNLNLENQFYNDLQLEHYIDNGCLCKGCSFKRGQIFEKAKKGIAIKEKIIHNKIVNEIIYNKNKTIIKINNINANKNKLKKTMNTISSKKSQQIKNNLMTSLIRY